MGVSCATQGGVVDRFSGDESGHEYCRRICAFDLEGEFDCFGLLGKIEGEQENVAPTTVRMSFNNG
jgi:hypothetical protein